MSHRALQFDWEEAELGSISAVIGQNEMAMNDGSLVWDAVALAIDGRAVVLKVTEEADEIVVTYEQLPDDEQWKPISSLSQVIGRMVGWSWVATNYRGYSDAFTLAIGNAPTDALTPKLTFLCEGGRLSCFRLEPICTQA